MKKHLIIITFISLLFGACKKSFLDEIATNQVVSDSYFRNYDEANTVLTGVYEQLQQVYDFDKVAEWGFNGTDEVSVPGYSGLRRDVHIYNIQTNNGDILHMWRERYVAISRANQVIARVGAMTAEQIRDADKARLIAEAKFIRGIVYFDLVKFFGDVPMPLEEITGEAQIPNTRMPVAEVYAQIIKDLQDAKAGCRNALTTGVATKGAATAMLGRVYLQMTGWPLNDASKAQLAAAELKEVIDNPLYGLATVYADVFSEFKENTNESLKENLFVVKFDGPGLGLGGKMGTFMGPSGNVADGGAFQTTFINVMMVNNFDTANDVRFYQSIAIRNAVNGNKNNNKGAWQPMKWVKPQKWACGCTVPNYAYDSPIDFALIRFSDVLLMYAEALNLVNGGPTQQALDAINRVRARARKAGSNPTVVLPDYTLAMGLTKDGFADVLLLERYLELCFEGLRRADMIRMGKYFSIIRSLPNERFDNPTLGRPGNIQDHHNLLPIPQAERDVSDLPQNIGYQ